MDRLSNIYTNSYLDYRFRYIRTTRRIYQHPNVLLTSSIQTCTAVHHGYIRLYSISITVTSSLQDLQCLHSNKWFQPYSPSY